MTQPVDLLTTIEVADLTGASIATVNRWAASGRLPIAQKLPGLRGANLFHRSDAEALTHPTQPEGTQP